MSDEFNYNGYSGSCAVSVDDNCLHGRILFINDLITYEGNTVSELHKAFKLAVDDYIYYCEKTGNPANKPYSGSFNVRIPHALHKTAAQNARRMNIKLNEYVRLAIDEKINNDLSKDIIVNHKVTVVYQTEESFDIPFETIGMESKWEPGKLRKLS